MSYQKAVSQTCFNPIMGQGRRMHNMRIYIGTISYSVSVFFTYDGIWIETVLLLDLREKNSGYHQYRRARP